MNYQNLTALDMGIAASLILINGALSLLLRLGLGRQLLWAAVRTVVQLLAIGYLLGWVFEFAYWYVVLPLMCAMTLIAGLSAAGRGRRTYRGQRVDSILSVWGSSWLVTAVGGAGFIAGSKVRVAGGEVDGVDMRLELGPTAETQLPGDLPLGLGQGGVRVEGFQTWQQFLGALALLLKVEAAVGSRG